MANETGGPAFPFTPHPQQELSDGRWDQNYDPGESGMTLRQYAAIKLRVPESGIDWLDDMIRKSQRDKLAGQALAGICADYAGKRFVSELSYEMADAMLAERAKP